MIEKIKKRDIVVFVSMIAASVSLIKSIINLDVNQLLAILQLSIILVSLQHFSKRYKQIKEES